MRKAFFFKLSSMLSTKGCHLMYGRFSGEICKYFTTLLSLFIHLSSTTYRYLQQGSTAWCWLLYLKVSLIVYAFLIWRIRAIQEIIRVLKPGGQTCITVWAYEQKLSDEPSEYLKMRQKKRDVQVLNYTYICVFFFFFLHTLR